MLPHTYPHYTHFLPLLAYDSFYTLLSFVPFALVFLIAFIIYLKCHHFNYSSKSVNPHYLIVSSTVLNTWPYPKDIFLLMDLLVNWFLCYCCLCVWLPEITAH